LKARSLARLSDRKLLQTTLELCRFTGPDQNGRVVVTLESERKMFIDRLKSPVIEQELKQVIQEAAARDVSVEIRTKGGGGGEAAAGGGGAGGGRKPPQKDAQPGPKAKRVLKKFGGRVVQVNPQDRVQQPPAAPPSEPDYDQEMLDPGLPPED
jgi:hypothetical protein